MTSSDLHEAVRNSFPAPTYLYMKEVRDATGFDAVRSADGIAVGMYRSCGRQVHGFEMKVSRTDWLKELSQPAKAESWMRYCHRWALIVPDVSIVHEGELPPTWGLGTPDRTRKNALPRIKWITRPPELTPIPFSMVFLTALLYASRQVDAPVREKEMRAEYERGKKDAQNSFDREFRNEDYIALRKAVEAFEQASGISISKYTGEKTATEMGSTFAEYRKVKGSLARHIRELERTMESINRSAVTVTNELNQLKGGPDRENLVVLE